ncbi:hypothetical protein A2462_08870 [candidate division WOR-1 bacterium RIFOXYC2_FULL_41_25]|uniref:Uncharacterized protein n=1 Tax=candidate division WOR-1 bacterium RIFOXYC2_FULL_41_25 TaxID=1802586 RepID=A0A1F4TKV2_UNCSA|nr:MAG: hypothetical protein A2462_08870 [candidate division WOR-1 bacterium RIFOXYC2_FULL_41_25]
MAIAGCSEPKTEQLKPAPAPIEIVDRGVDTPREAQSLVEQWRREGFAKLAGLLVEGTAVLWDPTKCAGTKTDYANGVALTGMQAVSGGGIEIVQPVHPSLRAMDVQYVRVCDDSTANLTEQPAIPVRNAGDEQGVYETLESYRAAMASMAMAKTEKSK